jgi:hypothetical protein
VTFVYVIDAGAHGTGAAERAVRRARRRAAALGVAAGETVVRAPDVPDGLRMAQSALGGPVCLRARERERRRELELRRVSVLELAW